jgi:hypothetical protein
MPRANLTVELPEGLWVRAVSTDYPDATLRVLAVMPNGDSGVGLLEVETESLEAFVGDLAGAEAVSAVEPLQATDGRAVLQFETTRAFILFSAQASGVALEPPVTVRDGRASVRVTATRERLAALVDRLEGFGVATDVEYLYVDGDAATLLTATQRDLLEAAHEAGYYETPRECTLTELADRVDAAKSTVSETLHRAESRVIETFLADDEGLLRRQGMSPAAGNGLSG